MAHSNWNWEQADWPHFRFDSAGLQRLESAFLLRAGSLSGALKHVGADEKKSLTISLISTEALQTSEIEGEVLNRDSVQSSIRRQFGLPTDHRKVSPAERGIAELMGDLYHHSQDPLTRETLFAWQAMLASGRTDLRDVGRYRTGSDPMQIVSGPLHDPKIHFEAPPAGAVECEMERFLTWFNESAPEAAHPLPPLTRAAISHLYFVSIHPFEDGNGRIGRAISEKSLSQSLGYPTLIALSQVINGQRRRYYDSLEQSNRSLEIGKWLIYFAETILDAQAATQKVIDRVIEKSRFFEQYRGQFNDRQEKALRRMFQEADGFAGGMSAEKYLRITDTSRATATRDLQELVQAGALVRTGERKGTRYHLASPATPTP